MLRVRLVPWLIVLLVVVVANEASAQSGINIYGYFDTRYAKTFAEPGLEGGRTVKSDSPAEFDYPFFNLMMNNQMNDRIRVFINMNGSGGGSVDLRNFWGDYSANRYLNFRLGKMYRNFGIYNAILDAVPTYYGIEPPELFDTDHLILSRTTSFMVHGSMMAPHGEVAYSLTTDNGEGGARTGTFPIGMDLNYKFLRGTTTLGVSGYTSGGPTTSDITLGDGSPKSGVLPWMAGDKFNVIDGYVERTFGAFSAQAEYTRSSHDAQRDPASVVEMIAGASPNAAQMRRFLIDPNGTVDQSNVNPNGDYKVDAWYVRAGYSINTGIGEFVPYGQWDYYKNPETIANKTFGGDNEAGAADDGKFTKSTLGIVYRPTPVVAVKLDGSQHYYRFNGESVSYPEVRFDVSFVFGQ